MMQYPLMHVINSSFQYASTYRLYICKNLPNSIQFFCVLLLFVLINNDCVFIHGILMHYYDVASCDIWPFISFYLTINQICVMHYKNEVFCSRARNKRAKVL